MKQRFVPGAEFNALTPEEASDLLAEAMGGESRPEAHLRPEANGLTTAAGALLLPVYAVPQGQVAYVNRLLVAADGFTFAAPFNGAGAMLEVLRNDSVLDGTSLVSGAAGGSSLPTVFTAGHHDALWLVNGDTLLVRLTAGPTNTNVVARMDGFLLPTGYGGPRRNGKHRHHGLLV